MVKSIKEECLFSLKFHLKNLPTNLLRDFRRYFYISRKSVAHPLFLACRNGSGLLKRNFFFPLILLSFFNGALNAVVGKVDLEPSSLGRKINGNEAQQEKILEKSAPKMEKIASSKNFERTPSKEMLLPFFTFLMESTRVKFHEAQPELLSRQERLWG